MRRVSGRLVVLGSLLFVVILGLSMRLALRSFSKERFQVTLESLGEQGKTPARRLPLSRPLRVRLQGQRAAQNGPDLAPVLALAMLLGGDGALLAGPREMQREAEVRDRATFLAEFPALSAPSSSAPSPTVPKGSVVVAVAVRAPLARTDGAMWARKLAQAATAQPGESHAVVFGRILQVARAAGGHAEMLAVEVSP